jgi:hypothetical protein
MSRLADQGDLKRRDNSALRWVTACLLPLTGLSSLRAEDSSVRTGLWVVQKLPGDESALREFAKNVNASRALAGVCLHIPWSAIEKSPGQPDFDTLDKAVAVLHGKAMKYQLCLKPGADTPAFVYRRGAQSFSTTITNPHRPNAAAVVTIPIPWDPIYQRDFSQLIAQLGSRYSPDPLCVSVVQTCANFLSAEMEMAALNVVHAKGSYWELWHGDGFDPKVCEAISRTWEKARGLAYGETFGVGRQVSPLNDTSSRTKHGNNKSDHGNARTIKHSG